MSETTPPRSGSQQRIRPNRAPSTVWCTRRDLSGCYVQTQEGDRLLIGVPTPDGIGYDSFEISRAEARLLAKRINECLDATVIR